MQWSEECTHCRTHLTGRWIWRIRTKYCPHFLPDDNYTVYIILLHYKNKFNGSKTLHIWVQKAQIRQSHLVWCVSIEAIHSISMTVFTILLHSQALAGSLLTKELIKFITLPLKICTTTKFLLQKRSSKPSNWLVRDRDKFLLLNSTGRRK